ncbi:putative arabinan endo-1,5-alpha-L-arabinosidase A [Tricharina praecox]|uniref:putative arabinan endo-1,5-alpha-L-arabinosidase A n=1 Tax=Tricharina praecox TaxID=43433 RepID=UPI00221F6BCC|nr:putative arabinan endo-1,5-alpha-L-arabinosidase A [Tricharina praecox]KAI5858941.1 putative arabinan endo-1,5-alpha-L-arabinosidase A [Tricharina praecox]
MQLLSLFLTALISLCSLASAQTPGACTGTCQGMSHDPAIIRRTSDGTYFRFSTANKINVATAAALEGPWTMQGSAIPDGSIIDISGKDDLWAPDVQGPIGDYYYLYYSVSAFGSQVSAIGVARSKTMDVGSWEDLGATGIASKAGSAYNAIDGQLVQTSDGAYVMTFGSFWGDLYQVAMADPPTKVASGVSASQVVYNSTGTHAVEAGFVYQNDNYYYMFFSSGSCCGFDTSRPEQGAEYRIHVCRSEAVGGPYVDSDGKSCLSGGGTTVLASHDNVYGPGGQGVFTDPTLGSVLYYHYVDTTVGYADGQKTFGWNKLNWSNGWPTAV